MKRMFGALVALMVLVLPLASAHGEPLRGHKMAESAHTPFTLARAIEDALRSDPSGRHQTIARTACSTPHHYMEALEETFDDLRFNGDYTKMVAFLRSLKRTENVADQHPNEYRMSRTVQSRGSTCTLDLAGYSRTFRPGEGAWEDQSGRVILADDCLNVPQIPQSVQTATVCCLTEPYGQYVYTEPGLTTGFEGVNFWCLSTQGILVSTPSYTGTHTLYREVCRPCGE